MLVTLRSILFNVLFYLNLVVQLIAALPTLVMPRRAIIEVARFWARTNLWLLRLICGTKVEFRGLSKIPPGRCSSPPSTSRCGRRSRCCCCCRTRPTS